MTQEIRTLADDELITEPGLYAISLDRHHSQPCDGVSVTSGVLRKMELETPADVWAFHQLNPRRFERPETDALRLGRAMAAFVEGGKSGLEQHFAVLPADKPRRPTAQQLDAYDKGKATEAGKHSVEFWRDVDLDPRDYITQQEMDLLLDMGAALMDDPAASAVMEGIPEVTMAWRDEQTGIWCLARPDTINLDGTVTDYKRLSGQGQPFSHRLVDRRITDHGYDMQLAFAAEGMERVLGFWPEAAAIIAQSATPPYHVILREILDEDLRLGQWRNRVALNRFAECLESGIWPGPGMDTAAYQRPEWQRQMLIERMAVEGEAP
jgi:hypothetical protein